MTDERFYYNMDLEMALRTLFGNKYNQFAGLAQDPKEIKKAMKDWIKKVENRIDELTNYDPRLKEISEIHLDSLKSAILQLNKENNDWIIIARLLHLISYLLGYDFVDGKIYRHVIFFRDRTQEIGVARRKGKIKPEDFNWIFRNKDDYRREIAKQLKEKQLSIFKISKIMNISQNRVNKLLEGK